MKKSFRHILTILGATWLATGITANAQTLTQDWKYTTDLPASANARWGVGKNGKIWTNDPATSTLMYWDAEGKHAQAAGVGGGGWALTVDDAGNVLVSNGKWGTASTDMKILPAGGDAVQPITLTMPRGVNAASIQYIARAKGDFMSEEGGVVYMMPSNAAGAAKIVIKNGAQVVGESSYISTSDAVVSDGQTLSVPLDMDDLTNDELAFRVRAKQDFYVSNGEEYAPLTRLNVTTTAGGDAFYWGGKLYTIEPVGTAYRDGFEVVDRSDPENPKVIASHVEEATQDPATKPSANCLTAEIVDEYTLNIYQYVPDIIVAKYTLTLPKPYPELTQDWSYKTELPSSADARWGVGKDGKIWTNNPATSTLIYWDAEGKHEQAAGVGGGGWALTVDDAGNVLVSNGKWGTAPTDMKILPAGGDAVQPITLTMPRGVNAASIQYIARAKGDFMSEEGGVVYMMPSNAAGAAKIVIKNGAQVVGESSYISTSDAVVSDGQTLSVPLDMDDLTNDELAFRVRAKQDFYVSNGEEYAPLTRLNVTTTAGGDAFYWGGKLYTIEPVGTAYRDGFEVVDRSDPENPKVIASHVEEATQDPATKPSANCLTAEIVDEYTLNIYQYVPDLIVAKYTLTLPQTMKPAGPALDARNAYAYDIKVEEGEESYEVSYRLNAPAESVKVQLYADGEVAKEYEGTTRANYTDDSKTFLDNLNTVTIPAADLPKNTKVSFRVAVTSANVETATQFAKEYSFWSPYGIAVDNNTDSPNFGRVLVTESQSSLPASGYHSSVEDGGIGIGIYAFDPMMNPIKNSQGTYGFNGGMTLDNGTYADFGGSGAIYDLKRLQYSDDGRLFVSRGTLKASSLWEIDPNNLETGATPVFEGTNNATTGAMEDAGGNFVAGPATAMTVTGGGEDLKVAVVSVLGAFNSTISSAPTRVDVYNLGTAKTWATAPSQALESVSGKYWVNTSVVNASFDAEGEGLFIGQHRASPSETEPAQVYVNLATGEVTYTDATTTHVNAMAWNRDKTLFAMSCGASGTIGIYEVTKDENGVPTLTQKYTFVAGTGTNTNALAFDAADNIYVASNSGELLRSFALPRESGECGVAAPSQYDVMIETPALEARNAYAYDIKVEEGEGEYVVSYRLNAPAETVEVQVANVANDEVLLTYAGTTRANYTDDSKTDIDNLNTVTIPAADLPEGIEMSFRVAVTSQNVETPTAFSKEYKFWSPYGIAVDNNTDSPNFGRVLVTESQPSLPATGYHTSVDDGGIGIGIYAFDPMMNPIKNSQGTYGFTGGMTMGTGSYPEESGGSGTIYDVKRLQYSEDGRLFVSRVVLNESSLWELDPNNLEAGATPVFQGTNGTDGVMTDASGNFVAGPATAMAVTGSGEDLKVAIVSVAGGYVVSPTVHRVDVYNLGTAKTWDAAPSQALESVSGKYWINTPMVNMTFDPEGNGLFIGQHRATPTVDEPAQVYVDLASGEVKYTDITTSYINAMAWNSDKSLLAMSCGAGGTIGVYEVTFTDGVPSFTQKYTFVSGCGGNTNAIAFDAADNLYVASNSGELLRSFAMPRESGECVVAAPSQYNVLIGELLPVYPETMYVMGDVVADADLEMTAEGEGVYTIEDVEISDAGEGYGFIKFAESTDSEETYGPAVDGTELVAGTAGDIAANGNSYKVAVAVYDIEIDLAAGTITLTWKGDAVESMEVSTAKVIGGTGEIRVVGDAKSVSIYNMAGQTIVLNSGEMTFNVASGYYIVVVDGKTTKVMVR